MVMGTVVGIIFGAIPGMSVAMAITLALPITFVLPLAESFALLCAVWIGATSGGLISAILINIPGTPSSVATCLDGYPMTKNGQAGKALGAGILYSFIGTMLSVGALMFLSPIIASFATKFGNVETAVVILFSLTMVSGLSTGSLSKGLLTCLLGLVLAGVGLAPVNQLRRFTFGITALNAGFEYLPVLIGIFAVGQILEAAEERYFLPLGYKEPKPAKFKMKGLGITLQDFKQQIVNCLRSAAIGIGIGILPGIGGAVSNFLAYGVAKSSSKHPEKFGTGILDGIVASETANNATIGGALIPMLTLGIPGDGGAALMMAAFTINGISPGPLLFQKQTALVYAIFAALVVSSFIMLIIEFLGLRVFAKIITVPTHLLLSVVFICCSIGTFAIYNRTFDISVMIVFGVLGFIFKKIGVPQTPFILGFILGPLLESALIRALSLSKGSLFPFVQSPIALTFIIITVLAVTLTIRGEIKKKSAAGKDLATEV
jgi:putative tricarboxylic transport membrane protein